MYVIVMVHVCDYYMHVYVYIGPGPFWLITNVMVSLFLTVANKNFFAYMDFPYPLSLSALHMVRVCVHACVLCVYVWCVVCDWVCL